MNESKAPIADDSEVASNDGVTDGDEEIRFDGACLTTVPDMMASMLNGEEVEDDGVRILMSDSNR